MRPILQPMDRVSSEALRADLNRPPALLKAIGTPEADAYVAQLRRSADGPLETARDQAMSIAASIGLRSRAEPLDWASGRRARIETRPGDWERLRLAAVMVERLIGDLVDPQLATLHARMTHHVAERIDREIADDRETRKRFKLSQPDPVTIEAKRRRAQENPFLRFRRDGRVLAHTVELVVLEASGAAWALGELDDLKAVEPDEHDRKVLELVGQVLDRVRSLHYQLREQTVVVREIAELHTPVDQLAAVLEQVSASAEQVHYQAIDRLWELDRDRIGKPRRFHRPPSSRAKLLQAVAWPGDGVGSRTLAADDYCLRHAPRVRTHRRRDGLDRHRCRPRSPPSAASSSSPSRWSSAPRCTTRAARVRARRGSPRPCVSSCRSAPRGRRRPCCWRPTSGSPREGAEEIVSIHLSGDMSGTFESAQLAARDASDPGDGRGQPSGRGRDGVRRADAPPRWSPRGDRRAMRRGRPWSGRSPRRRCSTSTRWSTSAAGGGSARPPPCSAARWR